MTLWLVATRGEYDKFLMPQRWPVCIKPYLGIARATNPCPPTFATIVYTMGNMGNMFVEHGPDSPENTVFPACPEF